MVESALSAVVGRHPLGLGAGPDRGGGGLAAALATGFASIEVGTVTARPEAEHNPGAVVLAQRLETIERHECRIGINIGSQFASLPVHLADDWLDALAPLTEQADYFTLNLSAPYYATLLATENRNAVLAAITEVSADVSQPLLVKLPFGRPDAETGIAWLLPRLRAAGIDGIVVSSGNAHADAAQHLRQTIDIAELPAIATGGVRSAADLRARLDAGAVAVQIYGAYADGDIVAVAELIGTAIRLAPR